MDRYDYKTNNYLLQRWKIVRQRLCLKIKDTIEKHRENVWTKGKWYYKENKENILKMVRDRYNALSEVEKN